jgi:polar amino acid transport system substrate-binding protein
MLQLTQKLGTGEMEVQEVPAPQVRPGMVLVQNHFSIISGGTEGSTVTTARKSFIGKAKERPHQVKQVIDSINQQGPKATYRAVKKRLDAYSPLGYSCSGQVIAVGDGSNEFAVGDYVACAGVGFANHAEIVSVPVNLCVKLNSEVDLEMAAYNTLGAIAMQSVRQSDLRVGESCVVIGLGLLGQLACKILRASGVYVIGLDLSDHQVDTALNNFAVDQAFKMDTPSLEQKILDLTSGYGADSTIIAAATSSTQPVNFAGAITRQKGCVVILGSVPTGFDRDPHWYRKELELKMACSYGPGRYDLNYEEKGIDYPFSYVRWTEKRNMEAFQRLISDGLIDINYMTTHKFNLSDSPHAYDLIANKTEPYIGIALEYEATKDLNDEPIQVNNVSTHNDINLSFIGTGSYAQSNLLPNIPLDNKVSRIGVLSNSGTTSKRVAEKFKFMFCTSREEDVFDNRTDTIFIATRHDSHANYVLKSLQNNKSVFVEKPLCMNQKDLDKIADLQMQNNKMVMVGFNRRFSPLVTTLKEKIGDGPMSMIYRVNAGAVPKDSWIQDPEIGGGRLVGEACHFIDLLTFINESPPAKISAISLPDSQNLNDTFSINIKFKNGSIGVIAYYSNGPKKLGKEYLEVFSRGRAAILSDFKELKVFSQGKLFKKKLYNQNKGQKEMVEAFFSSLLESGEPPIAFEDIYTVTKATFEALKSINGCGQSYEV